MSASSDILDSPTPVASAKLRYPNDQVAGAFIPGRSATFYELVVVMVMTLSIMVGIVILFGMMTSAPAKKVGNIVSLHEQELLYYTEALARLLDMVDRESETFGDQRIVVVPAKYKTLLLRDAVALNVNVFCESQPKDLSLSKLVHCVAEGLPSARCNASATE